MSRLKATLDFTQAGYDRLEELQEAMGSSSKADVLRSTKYKAAMAMVKVYEDSGYLPQAVIDKAKEKYARVMESHGFVEVENVKLET